MSAIRIAAVEAIPAGRSCYVRVTTEAGISGAAESTFFGWPTAVAEIVRPFEPFLQERDPPDRPGLGISLDDAGLARHPPRSADLSHAPLREDDSVAIR
jgi:L-alanine-DL-glutamate epimerase-like enolase superfamily enzyme